MSAASELSHWLSAYDPTKQDDERLFAEFLADKRLKLPQKGRVPTLKDWVEGHYALDFAIWLDNQYDLEERFEIVRNNDHIEGGAQTLGRGVWYLHYTSAEFTQFNDGVTRDYLGASRRR